MEWKCFECKSKRGTVRILKWLVCQHCWSVYIDKGTALKKVIRNPLRREVVLESSGVHVEMDGLDEYREELRAVILDAHRIPPEFLE